jgi:hypothetical protein
MQKEIDAFLRIVCAALDEAATEKTVACSAMYVGVGCAMKSVACLLACLH